MEAMIDAAVHLGFPRDMAQKLVISTIRGTSTYAQQSSKHVATLRNNVRIYLLSLLLSLLLTLFFIFSRLLLQVVLLPLQFMNLKRVVTELSSVMQFGLPIEEHLSLVIKIRM